MKAGVCSSKAEPTIIREMSAVAHVDGKNCLGPVVGEYSMAIASRKARETGIGWVVAKREYSSLYKRVLVNAYLKLSKLSMILEWQMYLS